MSQSQFELDVWILSDVSTLPGPFSHCCNKRLALQEPFIRWVSQNSRRLSTSMFRKLHRQFPFAMASTTTAAKPRTLRWDRTREIKRGNMHARSAQDLRLLLLIRSLGRQSNHPFKRKTWLDKARKININRPLPPHHTEDPVTIHNRYGVLD